MPSGTRLRLLVAAVVLLGVGGAATAVDQLAFDDGRQAARCRRAVEPTFAEMRQELVDGPVVSPDVRMTRRTEYPGDCESDGPSIEWEYAFDGEPDAFVALVDAKLSEQGWQRAAVGNLPSQLANFSRDEGPRRFTVVVFGGTGASPRYRVDLFAGLSPSAGTTGR